MCDIPQWLPWVAVTVTSPAIIIPIIRGTPIIVRWGKLIVRIGSKNKQENQPRSTHPSEPSAPTS